jgi:phosphoribosylaminoimidazole carboxylase PurE protein
MTIRVGILMGSDSDWPVMKKAAEVLEQFGVSWEARVMSAHRTPQAACEYASGARERGTEVLIAGAGGAAHLAGVLAAHTTLPVIGVPVANGPLNGFDALLATVQMPGGIPVPTVGIGRADNAALTAVQILARGDDALTQRMADYRRDMQTRVKAADQRLLDGGLDA